MEIDGSIFKAYDIRGIYPDQLNDKTAYVVGLGLANLLKPERAVIGHDMRKSSDSLNSAVIRGLTEGGANVDDIGLISTDGMYFAVGKYGYDCGIMITASHNPPEYNGMKICEREAVPLSGDGKLGDIKEIILNDKFEKAQKPGSLIISYKRYLCGGCNFKVKWQ